MSPEAAETLGLQALAWMIGEDDIRDAFLGASGASQDELRAAVQDPSVLGQILEFICNDDQWVMAFCDSVDAKYTDPMIARQVLPGGQQVHWT